MTAPGPPSLRLAYTPIATPHPVGDQTSRGLPCFLPGEVTSLESMDLAVRKDVCEVLVVRPRHDVVVASREDLGGRRDCRQQVGQHRVLLGVVPDEPRRLCEAPEVVGADVVLVNVGLAVAR